MTMSVSIRQAVGPEDAARRNTQGLRDGFVSVLAANGATRRYSTFLGGTGEDRSDALAVVDVDEVVVAGSTASTDFPVQAAPSSSILDNSHNGQYDVTVTRADGTVIAEYRGRSRSLGRPLLPREEEA